jgi:pimeloyl-ACP methyl ester carboxylesterase
MYQLKRTSRSEFIPVRHLTYHVRIWGEARPGVPPLVMVHGWMDVAASYQFVVDALSDAFAQGRQIIAPDWRGYGQTALPGTDNYWFPDYLADLDTLLDHYAPEQPVDLVGHSMGGNVVMLYAGVRPQRIRRLINLEGFGMPATRPSQAPGRLAKWMDDLKALHRGELDLKAYDDAAGVARRLMKTNPRLGQDRAEWLAREWAAPRVQPDGTTRWQILGDPAHKIINAQLYRVDEVLEIYRRITAPTLAVEATDDSLGQWWQGKYTLDEYHERLKAVPDCRIAVVQDAGHMLQHDQPEALAALIEEFLAG